MDVSSIIFLSLIVSAFVLFAVTLAYADYATRQARRARANETVRAELPEKSATVRHREAA